ncbi:MAG: hypothetical protein NTX76_05575 [Alphaproteobacteria bacterium]|nr:hypothetical protein [Alphaproteobacteria bacterium]
MKLIRILPMFLLFVFCCKESYGAWDFDRAAFDADLAKTRILPAFNLNVIEQEYADNFESGHDYETEEFYESWEEAEKYTENENIGDEEACSEIALEERRLYDDRIEEEIRLGIDKLRQEYPSCEYDVNVILNRNLQYWAEKATQLGYRFAEKGKFETADKFFMLGGKGYVFYKGSFSKGFNSVRDDPYSGQGRMHLNVVNAIVTDNLYPTSHLLSHLNKALDSFALSILDEIPALTHQFLQNYRDQLVRWHMNAEAIQNRGLEKLLYAKGFIGRLIHKADSLQWLEVVDKYDKSKHQNNLAFQLKTHGFVGVKQHDLQHNWVDRDGWIVRVKRSKDRHRYEFTVGICRENPVEWNNAGNAVGLVADVAYGGLIFNVDNEVFKLVIKGGGVFVVPSSPYYQQDWHVREVRGVMMGESHFSLPRTKMFARGEIYLTYR